MTDSTPQDTVYEGTCFCGAVQVKVTGEPVTMGYCHCESCQQWSATPVTGYSLWLDDRIEVAAGKEHLRSFNKKGKAERKWCNLCGGHVLCSLPAFGMTDVFPVLLPTFKFVPTAHANYQEKVMSVHDALPKYADISKEAGGSGVILDA
eukprot:TRINITY_DN170_c0_g1_i1.p1 TRINITY_DN170_c0_g1~~TRINITY_DN170_c0_g1_i1.p1  ORF type:complete len:159 (+),score=30.03 TRINITY_DN170_c0_g1_i1:32-478(+)